MLKPFYLSLLILAAVCFARCSHPSSAADRMVFRSDSSLLPPVSLKLKLAVLSSRKTRVMIDGLENFYDRQLGKYFSGGMLVARKGVIIFERYQGMANAQTHTPIDAHTTFQLASTSKPFTAMAILWLQQQGKLNIRDSIQQFFPRFPYPGITLKMLLDHRSGLPNYLYFSDSLWTNPSRLMTNQDVINLMIRYHPKPDYPPDTHFKYCNTNYCILGAIAEKVSHERLGILLNNIFFRPLNMKDTWLYDPNYVIWRPNQSLSYDYRNRPIAAVPADGVIGDKNIYSTPEDLLKWDQALYSGKLFTPATLRAAFTPYSNEHPGIRNYGLGWRLLVYPDGEKIVYHNGWWHGNNSVFYRFIDDSTTLIILCNRYDREVYQVHPIWKILHEMPTDYLGKE